LRAYVNMLRFEDNLYAHQNYVNGAKFLVQCYLKLQDRPKASAVQEEETKLANMDESEKRKYLRKKKKEEVIKQAQEQSKPPPKVNTKPELAKKVDPDPDGKTLIAIEDPIAEAMKHVKMLTRYGSKDTEAQLLACEVYLKKKKFLLALQSIKKAFATAPEHYDVHKWLIKFFHTVQSEVLNPTVQQVINLERESFFSKQSLVDYNKNFLQKHSSSLPHRAAVAEVITFLVPEEKQKALELFTNLDGAKGYTKLKECMTVCQTILSLYGETVAQQYKGSCLKVFPFATFFMSAEQLQVKNQTEQEATSKVEKEATKEI